jgi:peptidoglycan/LPS O-acetylase OafA/YrhL
MNRIEKFGMSKNNVDNSMGTLQVMRVLAAIGILSNHWSEGLLIPQTQLSIDFFFFVEGFLAASMICRASNKIGNWQLIRSRFVKIYPLYFIGLLAGIVVDIFNPNRFLSVHDRVIASVTNLFLQPAFLTSSKAVFPFNAPTWAIILEIYAFTLFVLFRYRLNIRVLLGLCLSAAALFVFLAVHWHNSNLGWAVQGYLGGFPRVVFGFFGGVFLFLTIQRYGKMLPSLHPIIIWSMFIAVHFISVQWLSIPLLLIGVPVIVCLGAVSSNAKLLISFGEQSGRIAYGIYLLHFPLLTAFDILTNGIYRSGDLMPNLINYFTILSIVIVVAYLATRFVDEPLRQKLETKFYKRQKL